MAVWWVWIYTSWVTNWLDPDKTAGAADAVRADAGGPRAVHLDPAGLRPSGRWRSPAPMCSCRSAAACSCCGRCKAHSPGNYRNFQRIIAWLALSGAVLDRRRLCRGRARLALWARRARHRICLARRSASGRRASAARPRRTGMSRAAIWPSAAGCSSSSRSANSILVTGATFAELPGRRRRVAAFVVAFVGSVAMWWIYFNIGAERGSRHIAASDDPGRLARLAYTYMHLPAGRRHHRGRGRRRARACPSAGA